MFPPGADLPSTPAHLWSQRLVDVHAWALAAAVAAMALWCGLVIASRERRETAIAVCSVSAALIALALSVAGWHRSRWHALALWAVRVDPGNGGLWYAAFSNEVRFVFVGDSGELSQSEVAPWVLVYLVAPFVALAAFAVGWRLTRRKGPTRRGPAAIAAVP
jgi:hypothetical protein